MDILVATVQVIAHERPRTAEEMATSVMAAWPGTDLDSSRADVAIEVAKSLGVVAERPNSSGEVLLHPVQEDPAFASSVQWTKDAIARTRAGIRDRVSRELMRSPTDAEVDWWLNALLDAVGAGIRQAFSAYQGDVSRPSRRWLIPSSYDRAAIRNSISEVAPNDSVGRVLQALTTEAIDPSVEFGSGVVTYLATGYVMHAFLARRDVQGALDAAGPLAGQQLLLDTPVLYGLLERSTGSVESLERVLQAAVDQRLKLVLPQHCVDELFDALERARESGEVDEIGRAVTSRPDAELYRGLTAGIISTWLSRWAVGGNPESWTEFEDAAKAVVADLRDRFGVNVVEFNRHGDPELRRTADRFGEEVRSVLEARSRDGRADRGSWQIGNDGRTLAMVELTRARQREAGGSSPWPGCWAVSPDTAMGPAFGNVHTEEEHGAVITASQLAFVLSSFVAPPSMAELAQSAAQLLSHDTFVQVASRFPPGSAIEMAEALRASGEGHVGLDNRFAQLSLREILEEREQEDVDFGTALLRLQARRRSELAAMQVSETTESLNRYSQEIVELTQSLEDTEAEKRELENERIAVEIERQRVEAEKSDLQARLNRLEEEREREAQEQRRVLSDLTREREQGRRELDGAERQIAGLQKQVTAIAKGVEDQKQTRARTAAIIRWGLTLLAVLAGAGAMMWYWNVGVAAAFAFAGLLWPVRKLSELLFPHADQSWWPSVIGGAVVSGALLVVQAAISSAD